MQLGVNIDHIAVLREARKFNYPNLIDALSIVERAGGDQITIHLREDRRHIQDRDVEEIIRHSILPVNLEMAVADEVVEIATNLRPHRATIVPEKREEVTTEGGLDLLQNFDRIGSVIEKLKSADIEVSLFIDPNLEHVELSKKLGADWIELHTGTFANIYQMLYSNLPHSHHSIDSLQSLSRKELEQELEKTITNLRESAKAGKRENLRVAGGHGLNYQNIKLFNSIDEVEEVNIGQSIVARAVFVGLEEAIREMRRLLES